MSVPIVISSVLFKNNPAKWTDPFDIEVIFEVHEDLDKSMEFQFVYVGSATDESLDQELECCESEAVTKGRHKLNLQIDAPDPAKIPAENIHDVTLFMFKGYYNKKMFTKICWFVSNTYEDEEMQENKPTTPVIEKLKREIAVDDVRVTNFPTCWKDEEPPVTEDVDNNESAIAFTVSHDEQELEEEVEDEDESEDDAMDEEMAELDIGNATMDHSGDLSNSSGIENVDTNAEVKEDVKKVDEVTEDGENGVAV